MGGTWRPWLGVPGGEWASVTMWLVGAVGWERQGNVLPRRWPLGAAV